MCSCRRALRASLYDEDGNLKIDGRWAYTWDSENRLKEMLANSSVPDAAKRKVQFTYDHLGRRASKTVWSYSGGSYVSPVTTRFVYDGWRVVAELDASNNVLRSYGWGLDLSGTMEGAGGIGGLWAVKVHGGSPSDNFVAYDGSGNVTALVVDASTQAVSARYEYGPFGELVRSSGSIAKVNPFRFSTKWQDEETELVYYGSRYYSPAVGRWISRDSIDIDGGANLYHFTLNAPLNFYDPLGNKAKGIITLGELLPEVFEKLAKRKGHSGQFLLSATAYFPRRCDYPITRTDPFFAAQEDLRLAHVPGRVHLRRAGPHEDYEDLDRLRQ